MLEPPYERILPIESADNFRDLGGYETRDGTRVRWRRLFRSGQLSGLTDRDVGHLERLGIREIHDFRRPEECERYPSRVPRNAKILNHELGVASISAFAERARAGKLEAAHAENLMIDGYRSLINDLAPALSRFMKMVADTEEHAILMHCLAGKDRTGIAAALLLMALNVPRETILADYMLSAKLFPVDQAIDFVVGYFDRQGISVSREAMVPYCSVKEAYLAAAFEEIDLRHGGTESYLLQSLELSQGDLEKIRINFLN